MSQGLKQSWEKGAVWFNQRPIRERVLITLTGVVLLLVIVWELAVTPVVVSNNGLKIQLKNLDQQQQALLDQQQALIERLSSDPSRELRERLASRQSRLDRLDAELAETTGKLIAPRAMVRLLQEILVAQKGLELVTVELLSPTPIFDQQAESDGTNAPADDSGTTTGPLLYAHDVELVIRGGYLDVLSYLETLEGMDNRLGWVSLDYRMLDYPNNEIRIRVRTLSLDRAWLGV
ncbi:type II secretion system protein GspM [Marinobacter confluentis]|uniref:MSHA biogenesis protein MshJ n=1 Tax=Marinobacter confluentis TaxID=1697557 RepID=A0A4Z1BYQ3_9GAMM|nr:type II secretion system protein GspM [Marinobacter confluentis]TGN38550.1 MSHA biogenesis protein MshJ [Marinobacter confluentis]